LVTQYLRKTKNTKISQTCSPQEKEWGKVQTEKHNHTRKMTNNDKREKNGKDKNNNNNDKEIIQDKRWKGKNWQAKRAQSIIFHSI
jgi:hypothetical protein